MRVFQTIFWLGFLPIAFAEPIQPARSDSSFDRAVKLERSGNLDGALEQLKETVKQVPNNPEVHNLLGVVLTKLGRLAEADEAYARALVLAPNFYLARKNRALNFFTEGELRSASQEFEALVRLDPKDFVPYLFLGLIAMEGSDFPKARQHLLEARQRSPHNNQALLALSRVHFILGERDLALELVRELRATSVIPERQRFELGVLLAQFEINDEAAEIFQPLWKKNLDSYDIGFNLALVQHRAGLFEKALQVSDELLSHGHRTGELLNLRGWIFNKMHQPQEARKSLELAIAAEPENADHYLDLSTVLKDSGQRESAVRVLTEGIQRNAEPARLRVQIGVLYEEGDDHEEAEKWYRKALETKPNVPAYLALARLLSATDRSGEARSLLERAIQNLPSDPLVHLMYGVHLLSSAQDSEPDQIEKAGLVLNKALAFNPLYANIHYWLGKFFLKKGNLDSAKACFEKACTLDPKHANSYYQLSRLALQRGEREKAANLAGILQKLHHDAQEREQETFADLVQDSLRGKAGLSPVAAK